MLSIFGKGGQLFEGGNYSSTNNDRHLGVYQELEIWLELREMVIVCALNDK